MLFGSHIYRVISFGDSEADRGSGYNRALSIMPTHFFLHVQNYTVLQDAVLVRQLANLESKSVTHTYVAFRNSGFVAS